MKKSNFGGALLAIAFTVSVASVTINKVLINEYNAYNKINGYTSEKINNMHYDYSGMPVAGLSYSLDSEMTKVFNKYNIDDNEAKNILKYINSKKAVSSVAKAVSKSKSEDLSKSKSEDLSKSKSEDPQLIRCTAYCDNGITASGAVTSKGCLAGKKEWIGKECKLYSVNKDGTKGKLIGDYKFLDTGYGLSELNGEEYDYGSITAGQSIDMWHPTEKDCWDWIAQYGDYVYMEFT